jgi:hypothetical protein
MSEIPGSESNAWVSLFHGCSEHELLAIVLADMVRPHMLDATIATGLFLSNYGSEHYSQRLRCEMIPFLASLGIHAVYCDLNDTKAGKPAHVLRDIVAGLAGPGRTNAFADQGGGVKPVGPTLVSTIVSAVDLDCRDLVFVVDGIERLVAEEEGVAVLIGLQSIRELVNSRPGAAAHFLFVGIGADELLLDRLTRGTFDLAPQRRKR